ncbi:MAG TPA: tetratricopeptide repeat protein [Casimicrobiaceae bacterium]|nr:tetratricopeptide repeat protein [Casimicrobiaceae bacterium]
MIDAAYGEWLARGQGHQQAGLLIDAMLCYRQALKINRHAVQAQFNLGEALRDLGRRDEAIAAWRAALSLQPRHVPSLMALAELLRRSGANADAAAVYRQVLSAEPENTRARSGLALAALSAGNPGALAELEALVAADPRAFDGWNEVAPLIASAPRGPQRRALLERMDAACGNAMPVLLLALLAEDLAVAQETERARALVDRAAAVATPVEDAEALRHLALVADAIGAGSSWAARYAMRCIEIFACPVPLLWPRRTAGAALRIAYLGALGRPLAFSGVKVDPAAYVEHVIAAHPRERFEAVMLTVDGAAITPSLQGVRAARLGPAPDPALARSLAEEDFDALIDLAGMSAATGPLLAMGPARNVWTVNGLAGAHVAPLITYSLPPPAGADAQALSAHAAAIEAALLDSCGRAVSREAMACQSPKAMSALWRSAVAAHQRRDSNAALVGYERVLAEQPHFAPARYLYGALLRDQGRAAEAQEQLASALAAAPAYVDARVALADLRREAGDADGAATLCREGLALARDDAALRRALGLAELARQNASVALDAFTRALALDATDALTHYNQGVALQTLHRRDDALRAYQRALALSPDMIAADFNIGVVFQEQGQTDAAVGAFERVLAREPRHVLAHKALGDTLLAVRRIDDWLLAFSRFEASCPKALSLAVQALEVCQYRGDFAGLDRYLDRLRRDEFKPETETDLADSLEQLLFLMLYFDLEPEAQLGFYRAYDAVAKRVYGKPMLRSGARRPGRLRVGYLSGDLRNHVMGKMMWEAIRHHDRDRFDIRCYSLTAESDEWTERFRSFADSFEVVADLPERDAALRIAADDLDILVDLSTHTKNARPGILALKPARVQITHIASCGALGLSAVDFKLTDAFCDLGENQAYLIETLLPMAGCVYPFRHVVPAAEHPFRRQRLGIAQDTVVFGAFVNPLKLSRRCLSLWRDVLERIPRSVLAISPLSPEARGVYGRLLGAAGIPKDRVVVLPQGRNDAESWARYSVLDFALDPLPYGGVNSTLEALDMGVPVVTLCGRKHGERTSHSILANLGVTQTVTESGTEYVAVAVRLATDPTFRAEVKSAIAAGLVSSALTDMSRHTRALEAAYENALAQRDPNVLVESGR